jgi:cyclopropane fatty-acyl-phospholipid synthase-like methyltransferase
MRVLDLGCGRAMSSIFLRRQFGVQVWATDLWFSASENHPGVGWKNGPTGAESVK